jgi:hypothetical protein
MIKKIIINVMPLYYYLPWIILIGLGLVGVVVTIRKVKINDMETEIIFVALAYLAVCVTGTAYFVIKDKIDKKKHNDNGNQA